MSADAKIWQEDNGDWAGICDKLGRDLRATPYDLRQLIEDLETAMDTHAMRWTFQVYPDGKAGLRGFTY